MKLKAPQLKAHLQRHGLAPVYLLYGEEPWQAMECGDAIRALARTQGYDERQVFTVENQQFDWKNVRAEAASLSLFARKRLLEVRLGEKIPADKDSKTFANIDVLLALLRQPPPDTLLLLTCAKLDSKAQKNAWIEAVNQNGVLIAADPIETSQFNDWLRARLAAFGLRATPDALLLLAERAEGHLLAAAQEVEKLSLLYPGGEISAAQVLDAVADSARFEIFAWLDVVLDGHIPRLTRQLRAFAAGGAEVILVASLLERDVRTLCQFAYAIHNGQSEAQALAKLGVWSLRKNRVIKAARRHKLRDWFILLRRCKRIEHIIKGMAVGNPWDELLQVAVQVAGLPFSHDGIY
jgi:DNA polymerase III subunit delta